MNTKNMIKLSNGSKLTPYMACAIAEGFCEGEGASEEDQLKAWSFIGKTGMYLSLQGWYGRTLEHLIQAGYRWQYETCRIETIILNLKIILI